VVRVNLITNPKSPGLARDVEVLTALLLHMRRPKIDVGVIDAFGDPNDYAGCDCDLAIFVETMHDGRWVTDKQQNWLIPNSEWYFPHLWNQYLPQISLVLVKTPDAFHLWHTLVPEERVLYTGFESRDLHYPTVLKRPASFLHILGKSESKGTVQVMEAWRGLHYPLVVTTCARTREEEQIVRQMTSKWPRDIPDLTYHHNLTDAEMAVVMNRSAFVIQPSLYEGYGHVIHEALGCRAIVLTTDAPPMSEFGGIDKRMLIPSDRTETRMLVEWHYPSVQGIRDTVERAVAMDGAELCAIADGARAAFLTEREEFRRVFTEAIRGWEQWRR
jgi:glycosyltransferase involved in cell wall biosynthesis